MVTFDNWHENFTGANAITKKSAPYRESKRYNSHPIKQTMDAAYGATVTTQNAQLCPIKQCNLNFRNKWIVTTCYVLRKTEKGSKVRNKLCYDFFPMISVVGFFGLPRCGGLCCGSKIVPMTPWAAIRANLVGSPSNASIIATPPFSAKQRSSASAKASASATTSANVTFLTFSAVQCVRTKSAQNTSVRFVIFKTSSPGFCLRLRPGSAALPCGPLACLPLSTASGCRALSWSISGAAWPAVP